MFLREQDEDEANFAAEMEFLHQSSHHHHAHHHHHNHHHHPYQDHNHPLHQQQASADGTDDGQTHYCAHQDSDHQQTSTALAATGELQIGPKFLESPTASLVRIEVIEANVPSSQLPEAADQIVSQQQEEEVGLAELRLDEEEANIHQLEACQQLPSQGQIEFSTSGFWVDDMAGFPLPPLDLDPLTTGLFSPCSGGYNWGCTRGDCVPRTGNVNGEGMADVLLSLKHAVVHSGSPPASYYGGTPTGHHYAQDYGQSLGPPAGPQHYAQGPAMSLNVSMNMTMNMNMHPGYEQNYSSAWSVEPLISPAPQYNGVVEQAQQHPSQQPRVVTNNHQSPVGANGNLLGAQQHHPPYQPHQQQSQQQQQQSQATARAQSGAPVASTPDNSHAFCVASGGSGSLSGDDSSRPNLCGICGKTYARPSTLKTHLRTHSGEKPFRCHACSKAFSQAANLTAHARTHSGEKPFRCPVCDRRFSQSSSVTTHMRTHSGERPYRCRFCKKAFSDSSTLTKHLRIHSGEKPYQCKLCLLRFSQSGNLNRHMRVHGGSLT